MTPIETHNKRNNPQVFGFYWKVNDYLYEPEHL